MTISNNNDDDVDDDVKFASASSNKVEKKQKKFKIHIGKRITRWPAAAANKCCLKRLFVSFVVFFTGDTRITAVHTQTVYMTLLSYNQRLMLDWIIFVLSQLYNQICDTFDL